MKPDKYLFVLVILFVFYTVGIVGLSLGFSQAYFLQLTPFNLILTLGILIWSNGDYRFRFWLAAMLAFLIGFFVEVAGVHTGVLFGSYRYGQPLGLKLFDVPLMIGVNWFILAFGALGTARFITRKFWLQWILASALMVLLDFFIEPVAIRLDFWSWEGGVVPPRNYLMWFITSLVVQIAIWLAGPKVDRKIAAIILAVQALFFISLNIIG